LVKRRSALAPDLCQVHSSVRIDHEHRDRGGQQELGAKPAREVLDHLFWRDRKSPPKAVFAAVPLDHCCVFDRFDVDRDIADSIAETCERVSHNELLCKTVASKYGKALYNRHFSCKRGQAEALPAANVGELNRQEIVDGSGRRW
jgi:hypothetical protein